MSAPRPAHPPDAAPSVPATEQLVVEIVVRNLRRSLAFDQQLGFEVMEDTGDFVALAWAGHRLFLEEMPGLPPSHDHLCATVRITVPDVDRDWARAQSLGVDVASPIADRDDGLRDFTIADPDGFGLRFGSWLPQTSA